MALVSTVAFEFFRFFAKYPGVMLADFCPHVWQTSVAKFYLTSVDEGVESGPPREVFVKQPEKFLSHIGFEVHTVWGVKPNNFALSFLFWFFIFLIF